MSRLRLNTCLPHDHRRLFSPLILSLGALLAAEAASHHACASLLLWSNGAGGSAATASNWSPAQIPLAADDLTFNLAGNFAVTFNSTVATSHIQTYRTGTVTLTASSPHTVSNGITIGDLSGDNPTFTLTTGTTTSNANVVVGDATGSNGTLNVNDDDADLIIGSTADLIVGNNGDAAINITGRGLVQVADQFIAGSNSTSSPTVVVSGALATPPFGVSRLSVLGTNESRVGQGGDATMTISNGALADFAGDVIVANGAASISSITVQTASLLDARLTVAGDLSLGRNSSAATAAGDGTLTVNAGGTATVGGILFVGGDPNGGTGHLNINSDGVVQATDMQSGTNGIVTLSGGTLTCDNAIANNAGSNILGTGVINADINNAAQIIPNSAAGLTINGTLFNTTSNLIAGSAFTFGSGGGYEGSGTCAAAINAQSGSVIKATGTLSIGSNTATGFFSNGDLDVGGNIVTLQDSNGAVLTNVSINSGRIECPAGIGIQNGGLVRGDGLFVGDIVCSGELDPHLAGVQGGLFTIQGDLIMNPTGVVEMEIGGTPPSGRNDRINISGTAAFDGTVHVSLKNGYTPQRGEQYIVANAVGGRTGTFANIVAPNNVCNGVTFVMVYSSTAAIVLIRPPDADTNDDGRIDVADLITVINQWGPCGNGAPEPPCGAGNVVDTGSPNGSAVNVADLLFVISHWGVCPTPVP